MCEQCDAKDEGKEELVRVVMDQIALLYDKDKEIERLRAWCKDEQQKRHQAEEDRMSARSKAEAEIAILQEGRRLHDELVDHLEHELEAKDAMLTQSACTNVMHVNELLARLTQAETALEEFMEWWGKDVQPMDPMEPHFVTTAREALAAIHKEKP
jgi:hypothetical protein